MCSAKARSPATSTIFTHIDDILHVLREERDFTGGADTDGSLGVGAISEAHNRASGSLTRTNRELTLVPVSLQHRLEQISQLLLLWFDLIVDFNSS